jgi:hypothetical protein
MQNIIFRGLLILFFACLLVTPGRSDDPNSDSNPNVLAQFKIERNAEEILLPVELEGKEYLFKLDTGSSATLFDISLKHKLRKPKGTVKAQTRAGTIDFELFDAPKAFLGPLSLKDCRTVGVVDLEPASSALERKHHGVIGMNFLKKHVVQVDFDKGMVSFLKSKSDKGIFSFLWPSKNKHPEWGQQISIRYESGSGIARIKAEVYYTKVDFTIDTGYVHVVGRRDLPIAHSTGELESSVFKKLRSRIQFDPKQLTVTTGKGKTASDFNKAAAVSRFSIGALEYEDVIFHESDKSVLGINFLSRHLVTFDFPNRKMYLKKGPYFDNPSPLWLAPKDLGFTIRRKQNDIFVSEVDPNGPAHAKGIRQKDIIIRVGDQDVASCSLTGLLPLISQKDKEKLTITIKRDDAIKQVSFTLNRQDPLPNGTN